MPINRFYRGYLRLLCYVDTQSNQLLGLKTQLLSAEIDSVGIIQKTPDQTFRQVCISKSNWFY